MIGIKIAWKQVFVAFFLGVIVQGVIYNMPSDLDAKSIDNGLESNNSSDNSSGYFLDQKALHPPEKFNSSKTERIIHKKINQRRLENGLSELKYSNKLGEIAKYHSDQMVERNFYSHERPSDGQTFSDRYKKFNYNCRVQSSQIDGYTTGAENIAKNYWKENVRGSGYIDSEEKLAESIVSGWMNSEGHRKNILKPYWNHEGIGVSKSENDEILVTQNFC